MKEKINKEKVVDAGEINNIEEALKKEIAKYDLSTLIDHHIMHERFMRTGQNDDKRMMWKITHDEIEKRGYDVALDILDNTADLPDDLSRKDIFDAIAKKYSEKDIDMDILEHTKGRLATMDMDLLEGMADEIMSEKHMMQKLSVLDEYNKRIDAMEKKYYVEHGQEQEYNQMKKSTASEAYDLAKTAQKNNRIDLAYEIENIVNSYDANRDMSYVEIIGVLETAKLRFFAAKADEIKEAHKHVNT